MLLFCLVRASLPLCYVDEYNPKFMVYTLLLHTCDGEHLETRAGEKVRSGYTDNAPAMASPDVTQTF